MKNIPYFLGSLLLSSLLFFSVLFADFEEFSTLLSQAGINVQKLEQQSSVSRFEIARLLNAVSCEDCVTAPARMVQRYNQQFWQLFSGLPNRDFHDITFRGGRWQQKSYYYCVAYVADNEYMRGYPAATSPLCGGQFCGQNSTTKAEFFQSLLNLLDIKILEKYQISRTNVQKWLAGLSPTSYQYQVLFEKDIQAIKNAKSNTITTSDEFQAYLKYCMFHLDECGFQPFGEIKQGFRPVSELNVLFKEGVIKREDTNNIYANINGKDALSILYYVFQNYSKCSFNTDYDCDGVVNAQDNCPYDYNRNQLDLDGDGVGNVCDDDIDGDGVKNPIGIVDDNDNIIISKRDPNLDPTPLGEGNRGFGLFINVGSISDTLPARVNFSLLTDGDLKTVERDMGDGKTYVMSTSSLLHMYTAPGLYTVKVVATDKKNKKAEASTRIYITPGTANQYALSIQPSFTYRNGGIEYSFQPQTKGTIDQIIRTFNNADTITGKANTTVKKTFTSAGDYVVNAKAYYGGEVKAIASLTIQHSSKAEFSSLTVADSSLQIPTKVTLNLIGKKLQDIQNILWNRGDGEIIYAKNLTVQHQYTKSGVKTLQQTIFFNDGKRLTNIATFSITNPFTAQSIALNISGKVVSYPQQQATNFSLASIPSSLAAPIRVTTTFERNQTKNFSHQFLPSILLQYSYASAGNKTVSAIAEVNRCVSVFNQGNVYITTNDICLTALKNGTLSKFTCDMDKDGIPDICDDDIDGDGVKNLLGLIKYENADCSYDGNNINQEILRKHIGVCNLDNCIFTSNSNQLDLNNNGRGDVCEDSISRLTNTTGTVPPTINIQYDLDQDGIPDIDDLCPSIPGTIENRGCPLLPTNMDACEESNITPTCGDGVIDEGEHCRNCPEDVGVCTSICGNAIIEPGETCDDGLDNGKPGKCSTLCTLPFCGNGVIDPGEDCHTCPEDVGICTSICGNAIIEPGETCDDGLDNGKPGKCSKLCTLPFCGNGSIDPGEDCHTCPEDVGVCTSICGNAIIEPGEMCDDGLDNGKTGKCSKLCTLPFCGNGKIDKDENCRNCSEDVGICTSICGNAIIEPGETCDDGLDNGKSGKCSTLCTLPSCGNGKIDKDENCHTCPEDVGVCTSICGNGIADPGETCENCLEDIQNCSGMCGNGTIEKELGEECDNGAMNGKDGKCSIICKNIPSTRPPTCGNGIIDLGETCVTCPEDVKLCISRCGNGKIEKELGEECDNGTMNGKDGKCSAFCKTIPLTPPTKPLTCGNGIIDLGETCVTCPEDVRRCVSRCGNGKVEKELGEECDNGTMNGKDGKCSAFCKTIPPTPPTKPLTCGNGIIDLGETCVTCPEDVRRCVSRCGNGKVEKELGEECDNGTMNGKDGKCSAFCKNIPLDDPDIECGNGIIDPGETCENCPEDVRRCVTRCGNGILDADLGEECDNGAMNGKDGKCSAFCKTISPLVECGNGIIDPGETCETCPEDVRRCVTRCGNGILDAELGEECDNGEMNGKDGKCSNLCKKELCGNGVIDTGETCQNCPEDIGFCIVENCTTCPCDFADIEGDLHTNDRIRAKLWDVKRNVFYRYSPTTFVNNFGFF